MVNQRTKGQHYVTEAYLRSFSDSGKLCCYRKPDRRFFKSSPEKICKKHYLYETELPNQSEDEAKELVVLNLTESVLSYIAYSTLNRWRFHDTPIGVPRTADGCMMRTKAFADGARNVGSP